MGLLDSIKKATGVGLTPEEHYGRAYEKGVLLGPSKFRDAVGMFETAAEKAREEGNGMLAARAEANAHLYGYWSTGDVNHLAALRPVLDQLQEIEIRGSASEMLPAAPLVAEIDGRLAEQELDTLDVNDHDSRQSGHMRASECFKQHPDWDLVTYKMHFDEDSHLGKAQERFFYHLGMAAWHDALTKVYADPEAAAQEMSRALTSFQQCRDERQTEGAKAWLTRCRQRRTCWFCHREMQGAGIHFRTFDAMISGYSKDRVHQLGQDVSSIEDGAVVLCQPCGTALERAADRIASVRADEVRRKLEGDIDELQGVVGRLVEEVRSLRTRMAARS
ncbi:MAG: hypothetical protein OXT09_20285 [Myxococcales bacterium]|nr:hypothetical protein [Myxococcales bacterium]